MLARIRSAAVLGIDAYLVDVETDIANGLPTFATVGLPQGAVKEGRERVYAAIANSDFLFPLKRITGIETETAGCQVLDPTDY
jgi:magnesium chelatase family protein